jgi:hypothetical protein
MTKGLSRRLFLKSAAATGAITAGVGGATLFNVQRSLAQDLPDPRACWRASMSAIT